MRAKTGGSTTAGLKSVFAENHQPLKWMFNIRDPSGQVARWLKILSAYQFQVEYGPGKKHNNADGLSRRPRDPQACDCDQEDDSYLPCGPWPKCHRNTEKMSYKLTRVMTRQEAKRPNKMNNPHLSQGQVQLKNY